MFSLVTSYYQSGNKERQKEIDACLVQNVQNVHIKSIHLLNDQDYPLDFISDKSKIVQVVVDEGNKRRLGYDYAIKYVNESLFKEHFIIANSDIYFDDTLLHLRDYDFTSAILALSRYDDGVLNNRADSQDCWIGLSPLRVDMEQCNFKFGTPGCDNRIAWVIQYAGYEISNPCRTIHSHHLHASNIRTYSARDLVRGPYMLLKPCELNALINPVEWC